MSFGKPFRASPVRLGGHYRAKLRRQRLSRALWRVRIVVAPALLASFLGNMLVPSALRESLPPPLRQLARQALYYPRCDFARAVGGAPILAGEPGYRSALDGDGDGIACEPYLGR